VHVDPFTRFYTKRLDEKSKREALALQGKFNLVGWEFLANR